MAESSVGGVRNGRFRVSKSKVMVVPCFSI